MKLRKRLNDKEAKLLKIEPKQPEKGRTKARYYIEKSQWNKILDLRDERRFVTVQEKFDKHGNITSSVDKLQDAPVKVPKNHEIVRVSTNNTTGQQWVITKPKKEIDIEKEIDIDFFTEIVKKHLKPIQLKVNTHKKINFFDRVIYTDAHIGMTPNENGYSLYGGKWNEEILNIRLKEMVSRIVEKEKGSILIIDDLGDFVDGWAGETTSNPNTDPITI